MLSVTLNSKAWSAPPAPALAVFGNIEQTSGVVLPSFGAVHNILVWNVLPVYQLPL